MQPPPPHPSTHGVSRTQSPPPRRSCPQARPAQRLASARALLGQAALARAADAGASAHATSPTPVRGRLNCEVAGRSCRGRNASALSPHVLPAARLAERRLQQVPAIKSACPQSAIRSSNNLSELHHATVEVTRVLTGAQQESQPCQATNASLRAVRHARARTSAIWIH